jgi:integrase/recombinase XerD
MEPSIRRSSKEGENMRENMAKIDVHDYDARIEAAIRRVKADGRILPSNKETIMAYVPELVAKGLTAPRVAKYLTDLPNLAIWLGKDFREADRDDINRVLHELVKRPYSAWTVQGYKVILKKFYQWLYRCEDGEYPPQVRHIKTGLRMNSHRLPEELWTEDEVMKLVAAAQHPRDKALIAALYESGCRVGELASRRIKHLQFDRYGAVMIVDGKTGMRRIRLVSSVPALSAWLDFHPDRQNPDAPLWVGTGTCNLNLPLKYTPIVNVIVKAAAETGIRKKCNPHIFRHSRATFMAKHMTEAQMNQYFGWAQGSRMAAVYVHLSGRDTDDPIMRLHGLETASHEKQESALKPVECPRCRIPNMAGARFCNRCAAPLDVQTAISIEEKTNGLAQSFAEALGNGTGGLLEVTRKPEGLKQEDIERLARMMTEYMKVCH